MGTDRHAPVSRMSISAGAMALLCHQSRLAELMPFAMFDQAPTQTGTWLKKKRFGLVIGLAS